MKLSGRAYPLPFPLVAPCAGAWIETIAGSYVYRPATSPPARGRGLKHDLPTKRIARSIVAPCAGAWIETCGGYGIGRLRKGRPLRGGVD